jgi:hypothetical protein
MIEVKHEDWLWKKFSYWKEIGEKYVDVIHKKVTMSGSLLF